MSNPVQTHVSLKPFNTFGIDVSAERFVQVHDLAELEQALALAKANHWPVLVIGGGSNLLLTQDVQGLVIQIAFKGLRVLSQTTDSVLVEAGAGEAWHPFVLWSLAQGFAGLENLSLIPGTVGAAPVQNVGAYGVEIKDRMHSLTALNRKTGQVHELSVADCDFAYRESRFKREKDAWVILAVRFRLQLNAAPHLGYGPVRERLQAKGINEPTASQISDVICEIRSEKLPDPAVLGNAGSFFKNPTISCQAADALKLRFPDLVSYAQGSEVKLAAGWLIEKAGFKGLREGDAGVHVHQALVLVNYGLASGAQMLALAERIQARVSELFGVSLEIEPNVI